MPKGSKTAIVSAIGVLKRPSLGSPALIWVPQMPPLPCLSEGRMTLSGTETEEQCETAPEIHPPPMDGVHAMNRSGAVM